MFIDRTVPGMRSKRNRYDALDDVIYCRLCKIDKEIEVDYRRKVDVARKHMQIWASHCIYAEMLRYLKNF